MRQLTLDDYAAQEERREREQSQRKETGIRRATKKAGNVWVGYALAKLKELCEAQPTVWAGDLRRACEQTPASPFAWATPWLMARRRGWIERKPVDFRPADWDDAQRHLNPVYRSLVYRGGAAVREPAA